MSTLSSGVLQIPDFRKLLVIVASSTFCHALLIRVQSSSLDGGRLFPLGVLSSTTDHPFSPLLMVFEWVVDGNTQWVQYGDEAYWDAGDINISRI